MRPSLAERRARRRPRAGRRPPAPFSARPDRSPGARGRRGVRGVAAHSKAGRLGSMSIVLARSRRPGNRGPCRAHGGDPDDVDCIRSSVCSRPAPRRRRAALGDVMEGSTSSSQASVENGLWVVRTRFAPAAAAQAHRRGLRRDVVGLALPRISRGEHGFAHRMSPRADPHVARAADESRDHRRVVLDPRRQSELDEQGNVASVWTPVYLIDVCLDAARPAIRARRSSGSDPTPNRETACPPPPRIPPPAGSPGR
jgi:hypothetical protein